MKKYFAMAIAALALAACDKNNDDLGIDNTKDTPITILSAGVADLSTRAGTPAGTLTSGSLSFFFNNNSGPMHLPWQSSRWLPIGRRSCL